MLLAGCANREPRVATNVVPIEASAERAEYNESGQGAEEIGLPRTEPATSAARLIESAEGTGVSTDVTTLPGAVSRTGALLYSLDAPTTWRPGDIETSAPVEVLAGNTLTLWRQGWRSPNAEGWVWWVSAPRQSPQRVLAASGLRSFDGILSSPPTRDWAAINGGFYDGSFASGFRPMGLVLANGTEESAFAAGGGSGVYYVREGRAEIVHRSTWPVAGATEGLQSIDRIVHAHAPLVTPRSGARAAARSAVLVTTDEVRLVIAVAKESLGPLHSAGQQLQQTSYRGMTLAEFATYLVAEHDAEAALNLDGAVSTQLYVSINDAEFRLLGERGTVNAIQLIDGGD